MKKKHTVLIIALALLTHYTSNSQDKPLPQADSIKNQKSSQADSIFAYNMLTHNYKKYILANRWGDSEIARSALYNMIIQTSKHDSLMLSLAYLYYESRNFASAALVCQELLDKDTKNINCLRLVASSLEAIGATSKALDNYETLYLLSDETRVLYKMARLQYQIKRYAEALTNINILLTRSDIKTIEIEFAPSKEKAQKTTMEVATLNLKGALYEKKGNVKKAIQAYKKILEIKPDFEFAKEKLTALNKP